MRTSLSIFVFIMLLALGANAQNGFIRGTVYDAGMGESLPGVTIVVAGTATGTITDLDGKFNLSLPVGTYTLNISFISYETLVIEDIAVAEGEPTLLGEIMMKEASIELEQVVVTAKAVRSTEAALLTMKKKSVNVLDGISATSFRKIGDSDAASSMKRISGVSVEGGKYVYVRGLGDRYTKTIMNGVEIPGLDPDRNTIQMDIFPTNVIDNIIVHKSFSAEIPADFTGGIIDIYTKDFPEEKTGSISISGGFNPSMHFNSNFVTYEGGNTDFLGFDDGTRAIPAENYIPFYVDARSDPNDANRYREILENFNPNMAAFRQNSLMDFGIGTSFGNQIAKGDNTIGYNVALSYKNETKYYEDAEFGRYALSDPDIYEMERREYRIGDFGENNVLISGLAGLAYKTKKSKYSLTLMHLQNGESKAGIFDYSGSDQGSNFDAFQHNLEYSQRSLTNALLQGKHNLHDSKWEIEWKLSPTLARITDPDIRQTRYEKDDDGGFDIGTEVGFPERIWRELTEYNVSGKLNFTYKYTFLGDDAKLNFGSAYTYKNRDFVIESFAMNIRNIPLTGDPNELFWEENLWPYNGDENRGTTYEARHMSSKYIKDNPNQYNATINNAAGYISTELSPLQHFKAVVGVRLENYSQWYTGQNQAGDKMNNEKVLNDLDFFPTANLIYNLSDIQNLRISYSKTIARPSFKELSFAEIYDPISDKTFVGGLYSDENAYDSIVYWDGNLRSTYIHNLDLRWELFGKKGQMVTVSTFYKKFIDPIEIVQYFTQTGAFQPRNVGDAEVYGVEFETRKDLDFISSAFKNLRLNVNVTLNNSQIKISETEYQSRLDNARDGETVSEYRQMALLAPYIINGGFAYNGGESGFSKGFEAGIYYNVQGQTLEYVGIADRPDIYTKPFHSLNFNSNKRFGKDNRMRIGIKIDNILNAKRESVFKSFNATDQYFERLNPGRKISIRFSYSFF